jgi:hypothetical protein
MSWEEPTYILYYDQTPADYSTFDRKITLRFCLGRISDQWRLYAQLSVFVEAEIEPVYEDRLAGKQAFRDVMLTAQTSAESPRHVCPATLHHSIGTQAGKPGLKTL